MINNNRPQAKQSKKQKKRQGRINQPNQRVSAPVAKTLVVKNQPPMIRSVPNGDCIIVHREYVADVAGSIAFANTQYPINPGMSATFPWLSKIARNYESYRFRRLRFLYETDAATSAVGTIILTVDYDASDPAPVNKQQAMAYRGAVRSAPWNPCVHTSLKEDLDKRNSYYNRFVSVPAATDIKLYDVGTLNVSTIAQAGSSLIGELYVEYDILLMTPDFVPSEVAGGLVTGQTTQTAANPFGTNPILDVQALGISMNASSVLSFSQLGTFLLSYIFVGTNITAAPASQPVTGGAAVTLISGMFNAAATDAIVDCYVVVSSLPATIDITMTATTITSALLYVGNAPASSFS
jgi:hypothetical protein